MPSYTIASHSNMMLPQARSQSNMFPPQPLTIPNDHSTTFDLQHYDGLFGTRHDRNVAAHTENLLQEQLPASGDFTSRACVCTTQSSQEFTPRSVPHAPPLDTLYPSSMSHPHAHVAQPPVFQTPGMMDNNQYIPELSMDRPPSFSTQHTPSPHFSWAEPDSMPVDLSIPHSQHTPPKTLPDDLDRNTNYLLGMEETTGGTVGNMLGWIRRAPTTGDRALPRLSTAHLVPPDKSFANLSPSSASTAGSSSSSRYSTLRPASGDFACFSCTASFAHHGDLTHHLRSHKPYASRNHVCQKCEKRFQYRKDLIRHLPRHDPHRQKYFCPFPDCKYARKGFGRPDHLDRHIHSQHRVDTPTETATHPPV